MTNFKSKEEFSNSSNKGEISYKNHTLEFLRFFESHKKLCDEIAGLKYHTINNIDGGKKIIIDKTNFIYGIRKLNSFIIDYSHYINEKNKMDEVWEKFYELEKSFINDINYNNFIKKKDGLSSNQEVLFNRLYINYLVKTFNIGFLMSKYLQKSLNIASREVIKNIQFVNYDGFYNNLSRYREEVANDLSNLKFENLFNSFKKLMGYVYTYRYLINKREQKHIDDLLKFIHKYIILDETIKIIIKINDGEDINGDSSNIIRNDLIILRNAFNKIYYLCNYSLSMKNILPKSKVDILIDSTLI